MRAIGESVIGGNGEPGIVSSPLLHPSGVESYLVRQDGPVTLSETTYPAADIQDGPPLPEYELGDKVPLYGSQATITARNGDRYAATIIITRASGLVLTHHYPAVPVWDFAIEKEIGNA